MDISDWEESEEEVTEKNSSVLDWSREFLSEKYANAPKTFLERYREAYDEQKAKIFALPLSDFRGKISVLSDYFYEFLALDWQNILLELVKAKNVCLFEFVLFLQEKVILPQNPDELENNPAWNAYQELLDDKKTIGDMAQKVGSHLKIKTTDSEKWEVLEDSGKSCYVLKMECASYARSVNDLKELNSLDVVFGVVKTNGLEYKSPFAFDEIVYYEV